MPLSFTHYSRRYMRQLCLTLSLLLISLVGWAQIPGVPIGVPGGVPGPGGGPGVPPPPDNILYGYPNPYANKAVSYQSTYLYTAAELDNVVNGDKIIYGLAWEVSNVQSAILRDFSIYIAEVDFDEIPASGTNASYKLVYHRTAYTETLGKNYHVFAQPYCYENNKNLLIKVCVQNNDGEKTFNAGIRSTVPDSNKYTAYHDWVDHSESLCNKKTGNAERYIDRPLTYFLANPISVTDFQCVKADKPSGLEFINSTHTPEIWIKNYSCLNHSNYEIGYQIEGYTAHTENPGYAMSPGEVKSFTFSKSLTLDKEGFHVIKYWVNIQDDIAPVNDTITRLIWVRKNKFEGLDYTGTDFWVGFMQNFSNPAALVQKIFVTTLDTTDVNFSLPALGWSQNVSLLPFEVKSVDVPVNYGGYVIANDKPGISQPIAIKVTASSEVSVYGLSNAPQSSDAYLAIPTPSLGREYFAVSPIGTFFVRSVGQLTEEELPAQVLLIGTEDGTEAKVVLAGPANGKNKGDTLFVNLNAGETYLVKAKVDRIAGIPNNTHELTGTKVISNHKIGVIGGSQCATIPGYGDPDACQYCDHIMEQTTPTASWGNSYYLTDFAYKPGDDIIRIVNGDFGVTTVNAGGTVYTLNNPGEFVDHKFQGNIRILATNPVQVVQMCTGGQCAPSSSTDPFYINAIPDVQWGSNYTFSTVVSGNFPLQYINVIKRAGSARVAIDGNMVPQGQFSQVPGTNYFAAKLGVTQGTHMVTSDTTISVSVYGFGVDDGYGFPASGARLVPVNTPPPKLEIEVSDITCFGYKDGELLAKGSEGTAPYQFIWSDGYIGAHRDSLDEGQYVVTLIDDYGYSVRDTVYVSQPDTFIVRTESDSLTCFETGDGAARATVYGGKEPYSSPNWSTGESDFELSGLIEGDYVFTISDQEGCKAWDTAFVRQPDPLYSNLDLKGISCKSKDDGAANINPSGGNGQYEIEFSDGAGNPHPLQGLSPDTYRLEITDLKGCRLDTQIVVTEPEELFLDYDAIASGCRDAATGKVFLTGTGGTEPYQFALGNSGYQVDTAFSELNKGDYNIFIRDANGCFLSSLAEVPTVPVPDFELEIDHASCGEENAAVRLIYQGGTAPYNATWIEGNDSTRALSISNRKHGQYRVIAEDKNCKETIDFTIDSLGNPRFTVDITPAHCGGNNGGIDINMLSHNGDYQHFAQGIGTFRDSLRNLRNQNYALQVSDSLCQVDTVVTVPRLSDVYLSDIQVSPERCREANGSATVQLAGGSGTYQITWLTQPQQFGPTADSLAKGAYDFIVDDGYCSKTFSVFINEEQTPRVIFNTEPAHCDLDNGQISAIALHGTGSYSYSWLQFPDSTGSKISGLDTGWYHLELNDGFCSIVDSVHINRVFDFALDSSITPTHCDLKMGGLAFSPSVSGVSYSWEDFPNHSAASKNDLDSGLTRVAVSKDRCTHLVDAYIPRVPDPQIIASSDPSTCDLDNGTLFLGGVTFSGVRNFYDADDQPVNDTIYGLSAGKYYYQISDGICTVGDSVEVARIAPPQLNPVVKNESCGKKNGVLDANASGSGNITLTWLDSAFSDNQRLNLAAGWYVAQLQDDYCTVLDSVEIKNEPAAPAANQISKLDATCNLDNGYLKVAVNGPEAPYTYSWNLASMGSSLEQQNLAPGTYYLTVDGATCSETFPFVINDVPALKADPIILKNADCNKASAKVYFDISNALGDTQLEFMGGYFSNPDTLSGLPAGRYFYRIVDDLCADSGWVDIPMGRDLTYSVGKKDEYCKQADGSIAVALNSWSGDYQIAWNDDPSETSLQRNDLIANTYSFTLSDSLCSYTETRSIQNMAAPSAKLRLVQSEACDQQDGIVVLEQLANVSNYQWSTGQSNIYRVEQLRAGKVWVDMSNAYCTRRIELDVPATAGPKVTTLSSPDYCDLANGYAEFKPTVHRDHLPYYYEDDWGNRFNLDRVDSLTPGIYQYYIYDKRGCSEDIPVLINGEYTRMQGGNILYMPKPPVVGSEVMFTADLPSAWKVQQWQINGSDFNRALVRFSLSSDSIAVKLIVLHQGGCIDSLSTLVLADKSGQFYFPSAFSPDNDGINDRFYPVTADILAWEGKIFNRWGEMIYRFTHEDEPWNGTYQGNPVQDGTYPVVFTYIRADGSSGKVDGKVTVIR